MHIAIISEDKRERTALDGFISRYSQEKGRTIQTFFFDSVLIFLSHYRRKSIFDAVITDVDMPSHSGMDAAVMLRAMDESVPVVLLSASALQAVKGYAVEAADFLLKPSGYNELAAAMDKICNRLKSRQEHIMLKTPGGIRRLLVSSVLYVEVHDHQTVYHTLYEDVSVWDTLSRQEKYLPKEIFVRCNSCYVVNLMYVDRVEGGLIELLAPGGKKISVPVSRSKKKEFITRLSAYGQI